MQRSNRNRAKMNGYAQSVNGYANDTNNVTNGTQRFHQNKPKMNGHSPSVNGYGTNYPKHAEKYSPRMNGSVPRVNEFGNSGDDSERHSADLREHMTQISKVSGLHHRSVFVPVKGPGREELDRMKNQRKVRTPRNLKLYDDDSDSGSQANRSFVSDEFLNHTDLAASIRLTMADPIVSNNAIEKRWTHPKASATVTNGKFIDINDENKVEKPKKNGKKLEDMIVKNVAIRGIVEHRKEGDGATAVNLNAEPKNVGEQSNNFSLIPDDEEPDFFYRKIQNPMPDDYFIVEHVGKVTKVTARQFLLENTEPEHFAFTRKNKN